MSLLAPLRHRGFLTLWVSQLVSKLGDSIHELALIWLVTTKTGDPVLVSATIIASLAPDALVSLPAGSLVDRVNRKYVLVGTELVRGVVVLAIPFVGDGPLLLPVVLVVAAVSGVMQAFFSPAKFAAVPNLVPQAEYDTANSLLSMTVTASRMLYVVGGAVVAVVGAFNAFYLDAASFLVSATLLLALPTAALVPDRGDDTSRLGVAQVLADIRGGLSFVRKSGVLAGVVVVIVTMQVAMGPLEMVLPFLVEDVLQRSSSTLGVLLGSIFAGMFVSSVFVGRQDDVVAAYRGYLIPIGILLSGVFLGAAGFVATASRLALPKAAACLGLFGAAFMLVRIPIDTLVQIHTPDDKIGKVSAILRLAARTVPPLSVVVAGPLVALLGPTLTLQLQAGVIGTVFVVSLLLPFSRVEIGVIGSAVPFGRSEK